MTRSTTHTTSPLGAIAAAAPRGAPLRTIRALRYLQVTLAAILAGALVDRGLAELFAFRRVTGAEWVRIQQTLLPYSRTFPAQLGLLVALSLALLRVDRRPNAGRTRLTAAGLLGYLVAVITSAIGNVPVHETVLRATSAAPPADWPRLQAQWLAFHLVRTVIAIGVSAAFAAAALRLPRDARGAS